MIRATPLHFEQQLLAVLIVFPDCGHESNLLPLRVGRDFSSAYPCAKVQRCCTHRMRRGLNRAGVARIEILIRVPVGQILRINIGLCAFDALSLRLVGGPIRAETRQRLSGAVWGAFGDQGSVCARRRPRRYRTGRVGGREPRASVVRRRAYNRQRRRCASAEKHSLASSLGGAREPEASPLVSHARSRTG
jgi:hypothetical protein